MALLSRLFSGDALLEAAAISDPAHIVPGARGPHVAKIQQALVDLDGATIAIDSAYGPATAAAVLAYKQKRGIINFSRQTSADNIVGKMTMTALDLEMLAKENIPAGPIQVRAIDPPFRGAAPAEEVAQARLSRLTTPRSNLLLAFNFDVDLTKILPSGPAVKLRLEPRTTGTIEVTNGNGAFVRCDNEKRKGDVSRRTCMIFDPANPADPNLRLRLIPDPVASDPDLEFGGRISLSKSPQKISVDAFNPGNAFIDISNGISSQLITVEVRAPRKGEVPGSPPTVVHADSKGFLSADTGTRTVGRPVNPRNAGRKINLAGEQETPGFEDYTADLNFSGHLEFPGRTRITFRPFTNDSDPAAGVKNGEAGNICIKGAPITDIVIGEIRRIRSPGCRLTFLSGRDDDRDIQTLIAAFPGATEIDRLNGPRDFAIVLELI